jgi:hypothetical protein
MSVIVCIFREAGLFSETYIFTQLCPKLHQPRNTGSGTKEGCGCKKEKQGRKGKKNVGVREFIEFLIMPS